MTEQESLVVLNAVTGIGNRHIRKLIECFGSAQQVLQLSETKLFHSGILSSALCRKILDFPQDRFLGNEYNLVAKSGVKVITFFQEDYPALLKEIPDAPVVLYIKGNIPALASLAIAVVGSRRASVYGRSISRKFSSSLAQWGITVVSGLARGIDTAAHEGCCQAKGVTVAVLGCGLNEIYPPENSRLAERILESGAVISEFPMTMPPLACNFPRRNRIISGLSLGVIVVEASNRSGAMITSRFALEQGREVFAVPGPVDHPNSSGVHQLIQQGARLISRPEDVLEELGPQLKAFLPAPMKEEVVSDVEHKGCPGLSADEQIVFDQLKPEPCYLDELIVSCGMPRNRVASAILSLEFKRLIRELPGKYFVRA